MNNKFSLKFLALEFNKTILLNFINDLDDERLNLQLKKDKWSLAQIIFHIIKGEQYVFISLLNALKPDVKLESVGFLTSVKSFILNSSLKTNLKFKAPPIAQNVPDSVNTNELLNKWDEIRSGINNVCLNMHKEKYNKGVFKHPFIGMINLNQTLKFLLFHLKHHLKQIENLSISLKQN